MREGVNAGKRGSQVCERKWEVVCRDEWISFPVESGCGTGIHIVIRCIASVAVGVNTCEFIV